MLLIKIFQDSRELEEANSFCTIRHMFNGTEKRVGDRALPSDGWLASENTIFSFFGKWWFMCIDYVFDFMKQYFPQTGCYWHWGPGWVSHQGYKVGVGKTLKTGIHNQIPFQMKERRFKRSERQTQCVNMWRDWKTSKQWNLGSNFYPQGKFTFSKLRPNKSLHAHLSFLFCNVNNFNWLLKV